ncbi:DUF3179 domain-containing (seleno)protein [Phaeodactylibacter sp.]|jgi:hypothetical protein|uniref:DUF3179 domain-containing (seleno)protein n=1 Tax=Phaeodactylibacter sp. TaxID=1940289 RepID=UPI0025F55F79|nr:DUF3179 domain-containing (seleno)protein [Phaeodactylibacter sp.]MCI4651347.1 DUF3179 domain-containing protein [Phaeodactylibacter sp.]MCI5094030.1 DUF3179 domain-containing protein [Phaeodactylibacter sp.]
MKCQFALFLGFSLLIAFAGCDKQEASPPGAGNSLGHGTNVIVAYEDSLAGHPIVVIGSERRDFAIAFSRLFQGQELAFSPLQGRLPVVMEDNLGNWWNMFGRAVYGPDRGAQLDFINSGVGYWFVFGATYPGLPVYGLGGQGLAIHPDTSGNWGVPSAYVSQGAGFDGIPALLYPPFINYHPFNLDPNEPFYLESNDLVVVVSLNDETKVYPHKILDRHEIVNDRLGGVEISVTYAPFTGTAKVWKRSGEDASSSFGVSGRIYNSNMLAFDRVTETLWHQIEGRAVFGQRLGEQLELIPHVETTWGTVLWFGPNPTVMDINTGSSKDYGEYPFGDYKESSTVYFPLLYSDDRLHPKERIFCASYGGVAKAWQMSDF